MRHRNNVKQLGRTHSHRDAMFANMIASFYMKESIVTTKQKAKELKKISEKLITRAIKNIELKETEVGKKLHNKRIVLKVVKDEDAVKKLFDDIAPRFATRKGGYTRIYLLGRRPGDAAEMALIELVEKKFEKSASKEKAKTATGEKEKATAKEKTTTKEKASAKKKTDTKEKASTKDKDVETKGKKEKKEKKDKKDKKEKKEKKEKK